MKKTKPKQTDKNHPLPSFPQNSTKDQKKNHTCNTLSNRLWISNSLRDPHVCLCKQYKLIVKIFVSPDVISENWYK